MSVHRRDQTNVFLIFRGSESEDETPEPTGAPTEKPEQRSIGSFRSCNGNDNSAPTASEAIPFVYEIETDEKVIPEEAEELILDALTTSMVNSIFENNCNSDRRELAGPSSDARQRKLQLESISPGSNDLYLEDCVPKNQASQNCRRYDGTLVIGFDDQQKGVSAEKVGNGVLQRLVADMGSDEYLPSVNRALNSSDYNFTVTQVSYESTTFFDQFNNDKSFAAANSANYSVQEAGISGFGKAVVPILIILFFLMVASVFLMQRSRRRKQRRFAAKDIDGLYLETNEESLEDAESFKDIETFSDVGEQEYIDADAKNLGMYHSKLDVHRCNNLDCAACTRQQWAQITPFNNTPSDEPPYEPKVETHLSGKNPDPPDDMSTLDSIFCVQAEKEPKKKGFFNHFKRTRTPPMIHVMAAGELSPTRPSQTDELDLFEDEPKNVNFVKIDGFREEIEEEAFGFGTKRSFVDDKGYLRSELQL